MLAVPLPLTTSPPARVSLTFLFFSFCKVRRFSSVIAFFPPPPTIPYILSSRLDFDCPSTPFLCPHSSPQPVERISLLPLLPEHESKIKPDEVLTASKFSHPLSLFYQLPPNTPLPPFFPLPLYFFNLFSSRM